METTPPRRLSRTWILLISVGILAAVLFSIVPGSLFAWLWERLNLFATVFLGIFIEAVPYLLLGTLASGLVEKFKLRGEYAPEIGLWVDGEVQSHLLTEGLMPHWLP